MKRKTLFIVLTCVILFVVISQLILSLKLDVSLVSQVAFHSTAMSA